MSSGDGTARIACWTRPPAPHGHQDGAHADEVLVRERGHVGISQAAQLDRGRAAGDGAARDRDP
jgi:hypothetical protein